MVRQTDTQTSGETSGPSLRTLAVVAVGGVLAIGAAYFVRPSPRIDDKGAVIAPVLPAILASAAKPAPVQMQTPPPTPAPAPVASVAAAPAPQPSPIPTLSPERQQLAQLMTQAATDPASVPTRSIKVAPQPTASPPPGVTSFAPAPPATGALQAVASLGAAPVPQASAGEAEKAKMAEAAARAIRAGDIPAARSILEASLAAGDQAAVLALAETYDPVVLAAMKVETVPGDAAKARELYEKAGAAGLAEARRRLAALKRYERAH